MRKFNTIMIVTVMAAMTTLSAGRLCSQECDSCEDYDDCCGYGYEDCRRIPSLSPAIALGTVAIVAIVAVAVSHSSHHSHSHN